MTQRAFALALAALALLPDAVAAGPWPRAEGTAFAASSYEFRDAGGWLSLYGEYGVTERVTLVVEGGQAEIGSGRVAIFSLRLPAFGDGANRFAFSFGSGLGFPDDREQTRYSGASYPILQAGASWGRGFEVAGKGGWATIDAAFRAAPGSDRQETKVDGTLGLHARESSMLIGQYQFSDARGAQAQQRLGLSWVEKIDAFSLEGGVGQRLTGAREADLKLGLWFDF